MTGAGTVDLPQRTVNYRVTPNVAGVLAVPVDVTGPWDNLSYRPDLAGIAKGLAEDPGKALTRRQGGHRGRPQAAARGIFFTGRSAWQTRWPRVPRWHRPLR